MKKLFVFASIVLLMLVSSCRKCSLNTPLVIPEQQIRIVNANGDNLVFGDSAKYDVSNIAFIHEREGALDFTSNPSTKALEIAFPQTQNQAEEIILNLDSVTSHVLTYNTLVFSNNECVMEYVLSYVKLNGQQVCGSCGDPDFNTDTFIYLML